MVWPVSRTSCRDRRRELLERRPTALAIPGDIDPEPGVVIAEASLSGHAGEVLNRHQCPAAGPDQQTEILTIDPHVELAAVDVEGRRRGRTERGGETGHELDRDHAGDDTG